MKSFEFCYLSFSFTAIGGPSILAARPRKGLTRTRMQGANYLANVRVIIEYNALVLCGFREILFLFRGFYDHLFRTGLNRLGFQSCCILVPPLLSFVHLLPRCGDLRRWPKLHNHKSCQEEDWDWPEQWDQDLTGVRTGNRLPYHPKICHY